MRFSFETVLWCLLIVATVTDLMRGKIYNLLTLPLLLSGILIQLTFAGLTNFAPILFSVAVAFVLFFPLYLIKAMAAGDVKLLMAFGAWSDASTVFRIGLLSICIGAVVGLVILLGKKGVFRSIQGWKTDERTRIAFAPAFLCAFMVLKIMEVKGWQIF